MAAVRLALFDVDGTLIQTKGVGVQAFARTLASEFQCSDVTQQIRFGGRTDPSLIRELFGYAGIEHSVATVERFLDTYIFWLDHLLSTSTLGGPCPGIWAFLDQLRALPEPPVLGLLTGNIRLGAEIKLRHYRIWDPFELGAYGDDDEDRNHIARVAQHRGCAYLERRLEGHEILVVGDTPRDIECGRAIEARVLAVGTGGASLEDLNHHKPDWLVPTLESADAQQICA